MITYSEIFGRTIQGEAHYNGRVSVWVRFFRCNLECNGFGQANPCDPQTYVLPYQEIDVSGITKLEDLPVFEYGCDSSYSWSKKFKHLAHRETAEDIVSKLVAFNVNEHNPQGSWTHPLTSNPIHLCFTGGEPMMQQESMIEIMEVMLKSGDYPRYVTIETNGTRPLKHNFVEFVKDTKAYGVEWLFSISPKLYTVSGEHPDKAWKPDVIKSYSELGDITVCKFVVNEQSLSELISNTKQLSGINCEFWAMPVGATATQQDQHGSSFIEKLIDLGFYVADRTHARLFANVIGK
jgi:7-carboxy-7-deazaguanine synthase